MAAFYGWWYPSRWLGWGAWPRFSEFGPLAGHVRFAERTSRKLARTLFHLMLNLGPKLEKRQALLFRAVDIGADLFAMAARSPAPTQLRRAGAPEAPQAAELADIFCRGMRAASPNISAPSATTTTSRSTGPRAGCSTASSRGSRRG